MILNKNVDTFAIYATFLSTKIKITVNLVEKTELSY